MNFIPAALIERSWYDALSHLEYGTLSFTTPNGEVRIFPGPQPGPHAVFRIRDWSVIRHVASRGDIALGEDYIDGAWDTDSIENLIALFLLNLDHIDRFAHGNSVQRLGFLLRDRLVRRNSVSGAARNIKSHYDVGNEFYRLWLDDSMTYSSALFDPPNLNLAGAQHRKYDRILDKFTGDRASVLEIGCGWGGFAQAASGRAHDVTGITISPAQHSYAVERLKGAADIRLEDYRATRGLFDMIVSIEMFEAVGEHYWGKFFDVVSQRLKRGGRAVVQTITIRDELFTAYRSRSDFIRHYVFPGGMLPSLKRFREEAEAAGLRIADVFSFGQDYVRTLREWSARLGTCESEVQALGYDHAFLRNWQFYLGMCAAAFAVERTNVVQVELRHA
ncbi:MAG TPA: cyclopropane-fatty-acyl-phospholipid synthase family protein [Micropepsaceae bacterium]|nr:cyclopropane-fatty-acyl-phospholipid synthase family protein [Micropepsaceae bacterium]